MVKRLVTTTEVGYYGLTNPLAIIHAYTAKLEACLPNQISHPFATTLDDTLAQCSTESSTYIRSPSC
jgi:hypothetical protein